MWLPEKARGQKPLLTALPPLVPTLASKIMGTAQEAANLGIVEAIRSGKDDLSSSRQQLGGGMATYQQI